MTELPNLSGFKRLLREDRIFVDYINAFLNLPVRTRGGRMRNLFMRNFSSAISQVFAVRASYDVDGGCFTVNPPNRSPYHVTGTLCRENSVTNSHHCFSRPAQVVEEGRIWTWVLNNRLPLFWGSELFLEWRLCSELVQDVELGIAF